MRVIVGDKTIKGTVMEDYDLTKRNYSILLNAPRTVGGIVVIQMTMKEALEQYNRLESVLFDPDSQ